MPGWCGSDHPIAVHHLPGHFTRQWLGMLPETAIVAFRGWFDYRLIKGMGLNGKSTRDRKFS